MNKKKNLITLYLLLHILNVHNEPLTFFRPKSNVPTVHSWSKQYLTAFQNIPNKKTPLAIEDKGLFNHSDTRTIFLSKLFFGDKALKSIDLQSVNPKNNPMHNVRYFTYSKIKSACSNSEEFAAPGKPHAAGTNLLLGYPQDKFQANNRTGYANQVREQFTAPEKYPQPCTLQPDKIKTFNQIQQQKREGVANLTPETFAAPGNQNIALPSLLKFRTTSDTAPSKTVVVIKNSTPQSFFAADDYNKHCPLQPDKMVNSGQTQQRAMVVINKSEFQTFATPDNPDTATPLISKTLSHVGSSPNKKIFALQNAARQNFAASNKYNQNNHTYLATTSKNQFYHRAQTTSIDTSSYFSAPDKPQAAQKILPLDVHQKKFQAHSKIGSAHQIQEQFAASINYPQPCPLQQDTVANSGQIEQRAIVVVENSDHEHFTAPNDQKTTQIDIGKNALSQSFFTPEEKLSCHSYQKNYTVENFAASDNCLQAGYNQLTQSMLQNHTADSEKIELPIIITLLKCKPDGLTELRKRMLSGK